MIISIRGFCQLWGCRALHSVSYYLTLLPSGQIQGGGTDRTCRWKELESADVTDKGTECFFSRVFLSIAHLSPRAGPAEAYLIYPCIHLYVKSDVLFLCVTDIWGLLEVNPAELRVVENHRGKKTRQQFPS